jgi:hypothetical protein
LISVPHTLTTAQLEVASNAFITQNVEEGKGKSKPILA